MGMPMNLGLTLIDDGAPPGGPEHDRAEAAAFAIHPPRTRAGLNPLKRDEFLNGLSAIRRACLALGRASGQTCLQLLDLEQIRYRFGRRWTPLRPNTSRGWLNRGFAAFASARRPMLPATGFTAPSCRRCGNDAMS